jgi:hypothetical protein
MNPLADLLLPATRDHGLAITVLAISVCVFAIKILSTRLSKSIGKCKACCICLSNRIYSTGYGDDILTRGHFSSEPKELPFQTPLPEPDEEFDLKSKDPKLYRPFRHGANHITMGIRRLDWNHWIEMDSNFLSYHDLKMVELNKDLASHVKYVDNETTRAGCFEVLEELTRFLTHRYPTVFQLKDGRIWNLITGEKFQYPPSE